MSQPIYKEGVAKTPEGAACPGTFVTVPRIRGKCLPFRAKSGKVSGHLPAIRKRKGQLQAIIHGWGRWYSIESVRIETLAGRQLLS